MKKPWPADAVMIIAAVKGRELRFNMESVVPAKCRDCGTDLAADSFSIRTAQNLPSRRGRPIKYFCIECCCKYDHDSITELHNHSIFGRFVL